MQRTTHRLSPRFFFVWAVGPLCVAAVLLAASPSRAQGVQKCHVDGRVVFQSGPCALEAAPPTGAAPVTKLATTTPAAPKKRTLADVLRERDGIDAGRAPAREAQSDGANVLRARMGAV